MIVFQAVAFLALLVGVIVVLAFIGGCARAALLFLQHLLSR